MLHTCDQVKIETLTLPLKLWVSRGFDHAGWFGHGFIIYLASDLLLCPFHRAYKKLVICERMSFKRIYLTKSGSYGSEFSFLRKSTKRKFLIDPLRSHLNFLFLSVYVILGVLLLM